MAKPKTFLWQTFNGATYGASDRTPVPIQWKQDGEGGLLIHYTQQNGEGRLVGIGPQNFIKESHDPAMRWLTHDKDDRPSIHMSGPVREALMLMLTGAIDLSKLGRAFSSAAPHLEVPNAHFAERTPSGHLVKQTSKVAKQNP